MANITPDRESRHIREVARAIVREIQEQGHFCLKAETIATMAADVASLKRVAPKVDAMAVDIATMRGQWKGVGITLGLIALLPSIGWLFSLFWK